MADLSDTFTRIYRRNAWAEPETRSGGGSTMARTVDVRRELPRIIAERGVRTMLDAGCGDFHWMREVDLPAGLMYYGLDVVPEMIDELTEKYGRRWRRFICLDIVHPACLLTAVDLILCRTVLFHLSLGNAKRALENFRASGSRYLLATTHPHVGVNAECSDGDWRRLNLMLPPFCLPEPIEAFADGPGDDGYLALWELQP